MPSTSGEGAHTGEMSWASIALAILAASFLSFLEAESAADLGIFETAATTHPTPSPASSPCGAKPR